MKISILRDREKYRVRCTDDQGNRSSTIVDTMTEARQEVRRLRRQNQQTSITIGKALELYRQHHATKGNRPRTIDTAVERVKAVFDTKTTDLSQAALARLWSAFAEGKPHQHRLPNRRA